MNCLKIRLLAIVTIILAVSPVLAAGDVVPQVHRDIHRTLQEYQEDARFFQSMSDSVGNLEGEAPFELYPSLDLYSEWNDNFDPMEGAKNVTKDGKIEVDLSGWVAPIKGMLTSPYGWRKRRMHKGVDIKLYVGDTVRAAFDGRVRIRRFERRGYGNYYVVRHANGLETIYGHLSKHIVQQDQFVKAGQALGLGGSTGRSTGPHLHFEMRYQGIALDPSDLIDFDKFEPKQPVYAIERGRAEWAQNNKGKRGSRYVERSKGSKATSSKENTRGQRTRETASGSGNGGSIHTVRKGDTLSAIARRYGTTVNRLCKLNGIKADAKLQIGKKIKYK